MNKNITAMYLTEKEASEITGLSLSKLRNDRSSGIGMPYCKVGRSVRYKFDDLESFMDGTRVETNRF